MRNVTSVVVVAAAAVVVAATTTGCVVVALAKHRTASGEAYDGHRERRHPLWPFLFFFWGGCTAAVIGAVDPFGEVAGDA